MWPLLGGNLGPFSILMEAALCCVRVSSALTGGILHPLLPFAGFYSPNPSEL